MRCISPKNENFDDFINILMTYKIRIQEVADFQLQKINKNTAFLL